jgi:hypothetical protein
MADRLGELMGLASGQLAADESVIGAAEVLYGGKINLHPPPTGLAEMGHHAAQVAAGEAIAQRYGDRPDVAFPSAKQMAIVLTDRRMLIWSRGGLTSKPKAFLGEVPLEVVSEVVRDVRHAGRFTVRLSSGWDIQLDVTRDDGGFVERLAEITAVDPGPTATVTRLPFDWSDDAGAEPPDLLEPGDETG